MPNVSGLSSIGLYVILLAVFFYFAIVMPGKKRKKQAEFMQAGVLVGDRVITIGGIIGTVVDTDAETVLLEVSPNKDQVRIIRAAIQTVQKTGTTK
ncbi:hypothetical protein SDC9_187735 [bioreactor metagenome]|uniref:Sec translocon accessory complex subunit YajC n=1 Tax=bioreactor metagenome TaxID=1076179 RepID=A0A645HPM8_9ZZZZ